MHVCVCVSLYASLQPNQKDENHAAIVIQSHVRGYLTRKQTLTDKQHSIDQLTNNHDQHQPTEAPKIENNQQPTTPPTKEVNAFAFYTKHIINENMKKKKKTNH